MSAEAAGTGGLAASSGDDSGRRSGASIIIATIKEKGTPVEKAILSAVELAEAGFGRDNPVTRAGWRLLSLAMRELGKSSEARECERENCLHADQRIKLVPLLELDSYDPETVAAVAGVLAEPFEVGTHVSTHQLSTAGAQSFAAIYTALRRDQVVLHQRWRLCGLDCLDDPSKYDIAQCAVNCVHSTNEYLSLSKRVHANQFIGCHSLKSDLYVKAVQHFWSALMERVFKSSAYFFGGPEFGAHRTEDLMDVPPTPPHGGAGNSNNGNNSNSKHRI